MTSTQSAAAGWGIDNDYARLHDVLLGHPEFFRWVEAGPIIGRTLQNAEKMGYAFDLRTAMAQHAEMVRIYEQAGVTCHFLAADEILHRNFFARDFEFVDVGYKETRALDVNLVALGDNRVLSMRGGAELNRRLRDRGFMVYDPDMSMFTLGGGGVHCLAQALRRDPG